ncbi:PHD zinc finger-containing putative transcriptional regulator [Encephalitozoon intestinalis ATCC 50506]|uniref:PHD zinc finger-containing putative transcriptional regulator n=1 Tax=Encephalitozoon intestinalis (strain ATCC 50506) TaxID=876142 RepID=E0S981_ENCIT|nr:PHD zinc finger-containing putative transcriptional regulator [Encephalitozoon intestinalis ATCC 50506]ADM12316.2 PHD zinc finger-containing putative transcriptional regulator [Encephalitozoon intestinalis ATCC 50506]UTX46128.1 ePHD domain-containing protein [Encephalitozoon intestinalis]
MSTSKCLGGVPREERDYRSIYHNLEIEKMHQIISKSTYASESESDSKKTTRRNQKGNFFESIVYKLDSYDQLYLERSGIDISKDVFELVIDRLEKEWFLFVQDLVSRHVKPIEPTSFCDICTRHASERTGTLFVCQGCGICVHENCYGIQDLSDFWLCKGCIYGKDLKECSFCPSSDGIFKQTSDNRWGHVLCAMFNRSLSFGHPLSKDPIDVSSYTKESGCSFCEKTVGTVICCSYFMCSRKYHVSCALDKCYFDLENRISYCIDHSPLKRSPYELGYRKVTKIRYFGYEKLRNPPIIRKKAPMACPQVTLFRKLCNLQPVATPSILSKIKAYTQKEGNFPDLLKVLEYWELKRRGVGGPLLVLPEIKIGRKEEN